MTRWPDRPHAGAALTRVGDRHHAAMGLDDPPDYRQAQPEASMRARTWGIDLYEGFKHVGPLLTRNTGPIIADLNDDAGGVGLDFHDDGFVRVTQGIA